MNGIMKFVRGWLVFCTVGRIHVVYVMAAAGQRAWSGDSDKSLRRFNLSGVDYDGGPLSGAPTTG